MMAWATCPAMIALAATPPNAKAASATTQPSSPLATGSSLTRIPALTMAMSSSRLIAGKAHAEGHIKACLYGLLGSY